MPKEKELLEKLPEKSREAFMFRVNGILLQVDLSKDHKFEDIRDEEGNIVPGGFKVEKGYIRVVSDEEFKNIHMDDLAYYTGITTYPPRKCTINPDFSVKFENVYKDRYTFETEGVKPVYAKKFISEFKAANKANRNIAERFNTSKQYEMHNKPRYIELSAKVNKKTATAEEKEEFKTLRFNEQRDGKTGYKEEEIGKSLTKYPDPNKKSGRAANPKFDTIFSNLRAIKDDIPVIESKNHQKIEVYGHQNNQPKIKINH